ncbi:MAG: hypothetical protein KME38_19680 [Spirirestis rafaelensis WJT71-NPBG6]|nr:hypothetical protein [Spirirestis rafaelensis WJT71-NPBG6]
MQISNGHDRMGHWAFGIGQFEEGERGATALGGCADLKHVALKGKG